MSWKIKSSKEVYKNRWMTITEDVITSESGHDFTYGTVHKKPAVAIIAVNGDFTYLVNEYRHPVNTNVWGFPQGHFEHDSIEVAAKHELQEEAGVTAKKMTEIGRFFLAPGHNTQQYRVYMATGITIGRNNPEDDEEGLTTRKVSFKQLEKMIDNGQFADGPSLACYQIFKSYLKKTT